MSEHLFPCWEGTQTDHHALKKDRYVKVRSGRQVFEVNYSGQVFEGILGFYSLTIVIHINYVNILYSTIFYEQNYVFSFIVFVIALVTT